MVAAGQRHIVSGLQAQIRFVIVRPQRLFEPRQVVLRHLARQFLDGLEAIAAVAHAPPGVCTHHQVEIRAYGAPHLPDGGSFRICTRRSPGKLIG